MRSASLAEWVFSRFTSRSRAASTVGDLLEAGHHKGILEFWRSAVPVLLSLAWRRCLAFSAALCFGLIAHDFLHGIVFGIRTSHRPPHEWEVFLDFLCLAGILLSFGMAYMCVRNGLKELFTLQIVTAWGLASVLSVYWWMPIVQATCVFLGVLVFVYSVMTAQRRRTLMAFAVAFGISFASAALFSWRLTDWVYQMSELSTISKASRVALKHAVFVAYCLGWVIQPFIYSSVHDTFFGGDSNEGEKQATA